MFDSLKSKLGGFKKSVDEILKNKERETGSVKVREKVKSLVIDRELIIDEKSIEKPLWDLEIALLESDVAVGVADEIIATIKTNLIGSKRKLQQKSKNIVEQAL